MAGTLAGFLALNVALPQPPVLVVPVDLFAAGFVLSMLRAADGKVDPGERRSVLVRGLRLMGEALPELARFTLEIFAFVVVVQVFLMGAAALFSSPGIASVSIRQILAHGWMRGGIGTSLLDVILLGTPGMIPAFYLSMHDGTRTWRAFATAFRAVVENPNALRVFVSALPVSIVIGMLYLAVGGGLVAGALAQILIGMAWMFLLLYGYVFSAEIFL
ncbi:hypothetical protein RU820_04795 [Acidithiobacillus ferrooxidans]|uniref:hypothetical protein n=1 Tax=Acidithiobacillus TaxID=119977 RepID=UPI0011D0BBF9|nr:MULTISPECIES: hypothetical protein [Acidithiobacillus]MBN6745462.1 hypothetical protein [Acidithiobacillus sp. MC2.2]MBN6746884.1 hypothetical protein [Acidithiobacillus sp. PG05]